MIHRLVEIAQQNPAPAQRSLRKLTHPLKLLRIDALLPALVDERLQRDYVRIGIKHHSLSLHPVAARTPDLLIIALNVARHIVVNHPADITLVDTHTESHRGTHHLHIAVDKLLLSQIALRHRQTRMIDHRTVAQSPQIIVHRLRRLTADAIDNTRVMAVTLYESRDIANPLLLPRIVPHAQRNIRPVKRP